MPNPSGPDDVVWYDFTEWEGLGGSPGRGGNAVFSGHVDYNLKVPWADAHYRGGGVFFDLDALAPGDVIEVETGGSVYRYAVVWRRQVPAEGADQAWSEILGADVAVDSVTLNHLRRRVRRRDQDLRGPGGRARGARADGGGGVAAGWRRGWDSNPREGGPSTRFPGEPVKPLQHLSAPGRASAAPRGARSPRGRAPAAGWRRGWDSNPRGLRLPLFESGTLNHSDTSPSPV